MKDFTFAEKLKQLYDKLDRLSHRNKSDVSYNTAREIATELKSLMPNSNNIRLDVNILDDYSYKRQTKNRSHC